MGQLIFGCDMILPIKHKVNRELIRQKNQAHINKYNIHKNIKRVDYYYKVGENVMLKKKSEYKYETPYSGPYVIMKMRTKGTVTLPMGKTEIKYNIFQINTYKIKTNFEYVHM